MSDGVLIALDGAPRRSLAGKVQSLEQPPDARLRILLAADLFDQPPDPRQRPQIRGISLRQSPGFQRGNQTLLLGLGQQRRPPGAQRFAQAIHTVRLERGDPPSNRGSAHAQPPRHFGRTCPALQQPRAPQTPCLQLRTISLLPHAPTHASKNPWHQYGDCHFVCQGSIIGSLASRASSGGLGSREALPPQRMKPTLERSRALNPTTVGTVMSHCVSGTRGVGVCCMAKSVVRGVISGTRNGTTTFPLIIHAPVGEPAA